MAQEVGQVVLKVRDGLAEGADEGRLKADELLEQGVQQARIVHAGAAYLSPVLYKDDLPRVVEEDVAVGITLAELEGDFGVEVVTLVLGFPVADVLAHGVFECAVGPDGGAEVCLVVEFGYECQVFRGGVAV